MSLNEREVRAPLAKPEEIHLLKENREATLSAKLPEIVPKHLSGSKVNNAPTKQEVRYTSAFTRQIVAAVFASLSSVSIGFITAYSSLTLPQLRNDTTVDMVDERDSSWIASLPSVSSIIGALAGGFLMDIYGPKKTLMLTALPCVVSWGLIAFANSISFIYLGRIITGVFLGIYSPVPQVYATEIAEPRIRGLMGAFPEAAVALGSLLCYIFGAMVHWRSLAVLAACLPGFPLFVGMAFFPESPQWLTKKDQMSKAAKSLKFFRDPGIDIKAEIKIINDNIAETEGKDISILEQLKLFRKPQNWKPVLIVFLVFMCGQFSGFAVVTAYTGDIFMMANTGMDANTSTVIVGSVRFISTVVSAMLLDRAGRKFLLIISAIGSSVGMAAIGIFFYFQKFSDVDNLNWLPLASLLIYVFFNELGYGPIPWLLSGELIPLAIRTLGNGVAVTAYSLFAFIIGLTFPLLRDLLTDYVTFWLYATFSLSGVILGFLLPETKAKTLEEIEMYFKPKSNLRKPRV